MRHHWLTSSGRWLKAGWFWPLVLLALPTCGLQTTGLGDDEFDPGSEPLSSAVMCDIPKVQSPGSGCADAADLAIGIPDTKAAVALSQGQYASLALDFSPSAITQCGGPRRTEFFGKFPDGYAVCLNCGTQKPVPYPDGNAVCVAKCIDLVNQLDPSEASQAFCEANAHVSTNFDKTVCYDNACSAGGTLLNDFVDPRRAQEPVKWLVQGNASATGNDLTRGPAVGDFNAGGYSAQTITHGDGWVEFEAAETDKGHALGLSKGASDGDPTLGDFGWGIILQQDGQLYLYENGTTTPLGPYSAGQRFRVNVVDNHDGSGTATVSYSRLNGNCDPGTECNQDFFASAVADSPSYPLRVNATLSDEGATLANVTLVRIQ